MKLLKSIAVFLVVLLIGWVAGLPIERGEAQAYVLATASLAGIVTFVLEDL